MYSSNKSGVNILPNREHNGPGENIRNLKKGDENQGERKRGRGKTNIHILIQGYSLKSTETLKKIS